jgi:Skp family chaperone for outer membrane proteins
MAVMIRPALRILMVAAATSLTTLPAHAQVFKCVDGKGKTIYLQTPCPSGASATVLGTKPPRAPAESAAKDDAAKPAAKDEKPLTPEEAFQKRQKERQEAERKSAEQAAADQRKQEECRRAKEQLAQYTAGGRISRIDDKGERYFLDDATIDSEKAKWEAQAQAACR